MNMPRVLLINDNAIFNTLMQDVFGLDRDTSGWTLETVITLQGFLPRIRELDEKTWDVVALDVGMVRGIGNIIDSALLQNLVKRLDELGTPLFMISQEGSMYAEYEIRDALEGTEYIGRISLYDAYGLHNTYQRIVKREIDLYESHRQERYTHRGKEV